MKEKIHTSLIVSVGNPLPNLDPNFNELPNELLNLDPNFNELGSV